MALVTNEDEIFKRGVDVTMFFSERKPEKKKLQVKLETMQLVWISAIGAEPDGTCE